MSSQAEKKKNSDLLFAKILEYDNLEIILSKIIVPFSKFERVSSALDLYSGNEKTPFEARDPLYKNAMEQEFSGAMRAFRKEPK